MIFWNPEWLRRYLEYTYIGRIEIIDCKECVSDESNAMSHQTRGVTNNYWLAHANALTDQQNPGRGGRQKYQQVLNVLLTEQERVLNNVNTRSEGGDDDYSCNVISCNVIHSSSHRSAIQFPPSVVLLGIDLVN